MTSKALTRDQILAADDRKREKVHVPEWGGDVYVTQISAAVAFKMMEEVAGKPTAREEIVPRMIVACCVDEQGNRLFTNADVKALGEKSSAAMLRVFQAAQTLNGLTRENVEALSGN